MEGMGDSYNEFMQRLGRAVASSPAPANHNDIFGLLPSSPPPCSAPNLSCFPLHPQQPRSLLQSNIHQPCGPISLSRSASQPSSFFPETFPQRFPYPPPLHNAPHSLLFLEASPPLQSSMFVKQESASSDPSCRTSLTVDVLMNNQETSPGPRGSVPSLPPLSPSINSHQSLSKRSNSDLNQLMNHPLTGKGHRRAHSEIPVKFSTGAGCLIDGSARQVSTDLLGESIVREVEAEKAGDTKRTNRGLDKRKVKNEFDWVHNAVAETPIQVTSGTERSADHRFSMFVGMETPNSEGFGVARTERTRKAGDPEKPWNVGEAGVEGQRGITGLVTGTNTRDMEVDAGRESLLSSRIDENGDATDSAEDSDVDESEREGSRVDGRGSLITENTEKDSGSSGAQSTRNRNMMETTMEIERSPSCGVSHHFRSASMDSMVHSLKVLDELQQGSPPEARKARHLHTHSMDGSVNLDFANGEFDGIELKKIMADEKLQEIALVDPKRAKRILANRLSAARSKERKMRYISELERKVQTLQTEATSLSTQLTLLQRDSTGLSNENSELKLRLQAMEQQAHLQEALNEALREEVQRLKLAVAQIAGQAPPNQHIFPAAHQGPQGPIQQVQEQQARSSGHLSSSHQNDQSGFFQNTFGAAFSGLTTST